MTKNATIAEQITGIISAYAADFLAPSAAATAIVTAAGHAAEFKIVMVDHMDEVQRNDNALGLAIAKAQKAAEKAEKAAEKAAGEFKIELLPEKEPFPTMLRFTGKGKPKNLSASLLREIVKHGKEVVALCDQGDDR